MCIEELSTETNGIETVVVRYGVATIFATGDFLEEFSAGWVNDIRCMWWFGK
jgi:hypothetical protein